MPLSGTTQRATDSAKREQSARQIRLPGFLVDQPVGLGDVVKRATSAIGIKPCGPCSERARRLNQWLIFTGRNG
jgi:hypothetical protein